MCTKNWCYCDNAKETRGGGEGVWSLAGRGSGQGEWGVAGLADPDENQELKVLLKEHKGTV